LSGSINKKLVKSLTTTKNHNNTNQAFPLPDCDKKRSEIQNEVGTTTKNHPLKILKI